ncbi:MAG: 50S ribosomal protein L4 [Planctomycetota bacterium]|jgi:large subunit ribosomal protein L4
MADLPLFDKEGKSAGTVAVDEKVFGEKVRKKLLHQVVVIYEGNRRQGTASAKTRSEVSYSVKKPWPQKHTGMARAGSRRSPIWRHGGATFGPRPRDHRKGMTPKMRGAALDSAVLGKIRDNEISVIEGFEFGEPQTKRMAGILKETGLKGRMLIATGGNDRNTWLSARNIEGVSMQEVKDLNAYEILLNRNLLLTKGALDALVKARGKKK